MNIIMYIQKQYLEVEDAVIAWTDAPERYLEDHVAVLTC